MSDIPIISVTQECSDDELEGVSKLNINECHTDTEDLIMEQDSVRFRKSPKPINAMIDAITPTTNGAVTDVEDCSDSDDDESEVKSAREADIALDSFLDQGYVDESSNTGNTGGKPKVVSHSFSKAAEGNSLQVLVDTSGALTDCEDCALSDDDDSLGHVSIPDCPDDILMKDNENDAVDIHNVVKRKQTQHFHKQEIVDESSSDSDNDCKVRHRKCHRKSEDRSNKSDCENMSLSDEEMSAGACAKPPNRHSALFEVEELVMESSDVEEDRMQAFPEINITFVSEGQEPQSKSSSTKRPATLSVQAPNADEALTDVENLDSSDDDDDERERSNKKLMPRAVVRHGKTGGGKTDVEDFNTSDDNEEPEQKRAVGQEFLPSPIREIAIVHHNASGEQRQNVMPLNQGLLTIRTPDIEQALTDVEDMSDNEEPGEMYDSSKYVIDALPEMESGDIYSSDNSHVQAAKLEIANRPQEPVTDTEDLFFERSTSGSGTGSELRRRRKPKHSHSNGGVSHQYKGKKFLEMKTETAATATTDVEDMYLSDEGNNCGFTKQRRATIQMGGLIINHDDQDAKTDVEFLSGDELERTVQSPLLYNDGYASVIKAREQNGPFRSHLMDPSPIPMIRKFSPTPDAQNCQTDCEDIQMMSDGEDQCVSRAQTATPYELTRALEESVNCEIHESSIHRKNCLLDIKGGEQQEIHTDVEELDDAEQ